MADIGWPTRVADVDQWLTATSRLGLLPRCIVCNAVFPMSVCPSVCLSVRPQSDRFMPVLARYLQSPYRTSTYDLQSCFVRKLSAAGL